MTRIRQLWDLFVSAESSSYEKSTWCDIFLCQFLISLYDGVSVEDIITWSNRNGIGTLIACELLSDIEQVCSQPGDGEDLQPLKRHLLSKAWKPLAALISLGQQNLSCSHELANLLISLFPICLETSNNSTDATMAKKNQYLRLNSVDDIDSTLSLCLLGSKNCGQGTVRAEHFRSHAPASSLRCRKTSRGSNCMRWNNDIQSSESENPCEDLKMANKALKLKMEVNDFNNCALNSDEGSGGGDKEAFESILYKPRWRSRHPKKISPFDFIDERIKDVMQSHVTPYEFSLLVTQLLTSLCRSEQCFSIGADHSYSVCLKSVKFALEHLCSIQFGSLLVSALESREAANLKCALTHLLVTSLEKIMTCPDVFTNVILTGILPMSLKVLEDSVCKLSCSLHSSDANQESFYENEKQHEVIFGLICSVISFLCNFLLGNPDVEKVRNFLELFKIFIESNNGKLIEKTIVVLVKFGKMAKAKKVIELIGELIVELKEVRRHVTNPQFNKRTKQKKHKNTAELHHHHHPHYYNHNHNHHHHHHDLFGLVFTTSAVGSNVPQNCSISSLFLVLVRLLGKSYEMPPDIVNRILKVMGACGTCCCFTMKNLFRPFIEIIKCSSSKTRVLVFQLLETTLYPELGCFDVPSNEQVQCLVCARYSFEGIKRKLDRFEECGQSEEGTYLGTSGVEHPALRLGVFKELLSSDDFKIVQTVACHLLKCAPKMCQAGKCTVLFDIFFPIFLTNKSKFLTERDELSAFKIMSCLSMFSSLLDGLPFSRRFILQKGLDHVLELISVTNFTEKCCSVLEKTIIFTISASDADSTNVSSLATLKKAVDEANGYFFKWFDSTDKKVEMERVELDGMTKILENVSIFWNTYANLALYSPILRANFCNETFQTDAYRLLKTTLHLLTINDFKDRRKSTNNRDLSANTCWVMKLIESLLMFILATSQKETGECNYTITEELFRDFSIDNLQNVNIRRLAEVLLKCSLVHPNRFQIVSSESASKFFLIPLRGSCMEVGDENDEEEHLITESDSLDDNYVTADEGYDADVEIRDNFASPGETIDETLTADFEDSSGFLPEAESFCDKIEQKSGHLIVYPNLCLLAIDLLIKSYNKKSIDKCERKNWGLAENEIEEEEMKNWTTNNVCQLPGVPKTETNNVAPGKEMSLDESKKLAPETEDKSFSGLVSVFQRLVSLCKENQENCVVLCKNGVILRLLSGFQSCFTNRKNFLSDLQKVILDLFTILAKHSITPKELSVYFSFFKHENPPLDHLLVPLLSLVSSYSPQPIRSLRFPAACSKHHMDHHRDITDFGKKMHLRHKVEGVESCWSATALSLPIGPERNWSVWAHGFSLSIWIKVEKSATKILATKMKQNGQNRHGGKMSKLDSYEFSERRIGSVALPNTYLNNNLRFTSSKQILQGKCLHVFSLGNDHLTVECWNAPDLDSFIWRLSRIDSQRGYEIVAERTVEHHLPTSTWTHLAINVKMLSSRKATAVQVYAMFQIGIFSNGKKEVLVILPLSGLPSRRYRTSALLLGSKEESSTKESFFFGSLMLFACPVFARETAIYLLALGPNYNLFMDNRGGRQKPNFTTIFPMKNLTNEINWESVLDPKSEIVQNARNHLLLFYSARNPAWFDVYPVSSSGIGSFLFPNMRNKSGPESKGTQQAPVSLQCSVLASLDQYEYRGLISSAYVLGGSAAFMFLFARVVEISRDPEEQGKFLYIFLKFVQSDCDLFTDFVNNEHYNMLHKVFFASKCWSGPHILKAVLNACCDKPIIRNVENQFEVIQQSDSIIVNSFLIKTLLTSWKDWSSVTEANQILHLMLSALLALVKDEHPYREFNVFQLNRVEIVRGLLSFCKERLLFDEMSMVAPNVSLCLVELIKSLMSAPPDTAHIAAVMDCLILLHPAHATFITHVKTSFYLIFSPGNAYYIQGSPECKPGVQRFSNTWMTGLNSTPDSRQIATRNLNQSADSITSVYNALDRLQSPSHNFYKQKGKFDTVDGECLNIKSVVEVVNEPMNLEQNDSTKSSAFSRSQPNFTSFIAEMLADSHTSKRHMNKAEEESNLKTREKTEIVENRSSQSIIVEGLLLLLRDIVLMLPDNTTPLILNHIIKPEILLVLANQKDNKVRSAVVKVFSSYLQRCSDEDLSKFIKLRGFYHLANQISLFPASSDLLEACLQILAPGSACSQIEDFLQEPRFAIASFPIFLALAPRCVHDTALACNLINLLFRIYSKDEYFARHLLDVGLIESLTKTLIVFAHFDAEEVDDFRQSLVWTDLMKFYLGILSRTLSTPGASNTQVFTDILLEMHYVMGLEKENCGVQSKCVGLIRDMFFKMLEKSLDILVKKMLSIENNQKSTSSVFYPGVNGNYKEVSTVTNNFTNGFGSGRSVGSPQVAQPSKLLSKSELCERVKLIVVSAVEMLTFSDNSKNQCSSLSQTEVGFAFYIFPTLLQILSSNGEKRNVDSSGLYWAAKDTVRTETFKLLAWMISPRQTVRIRVFAITALASQTNSRNLLLMLLSSSAQAEQIFVAYLSDLMRSTKLSNGDIKCCLDLRNVIQDNKIFFENTLSRSQGESLRESEDVFLAEADRLLTTWKKEMVTATVKCCNKYDGLVKSMSDDAVVMTRLVIDAQNMERKSFMEEIKLRYCEDVHLSVKWTELINRLTHEKAVWHFENMYPNFWELDPTEGPSRVRKRLSRCFLPLDERYFLPSERHKLIGNQVRKPLAFLFRNGEKSRASAALIEKLHCNEKIRAMYSASIVTPAAEILGELLLGETSIYFVADDRQPTQECSDLTATAWLFRDVKEIYSRRHELQERAIEIFLTNGKTYFIALESSEDRDALMKELLECELPNRVTGDNMADIMQLWREGLITNWEYLTQLNKLAGRSYNDLMQYPVYPFVLSDYSSPMLDLCASESYRNFNKPMAVQEKKNEQHYINNYKELLSGLKQVSLNKEPYHYGSHYSNSGTVLHFLVRLPPFTKMFLQYQDRNFDLPDRTFHSLHTTWRLASSESTTDVKEMIPEFFFLPEFLINFQGFNFGVKQNGETVSDVVLPPWCGGDPRKFILMHRQALESDYVTENLPHWIDLVFGFKQTGKAAVEAINVFHPATYCGFDVATISDPVERIAWETMIKTYGQTPKQLLKTPHPLTSKPVVPTVVLPELSVDGVRGLKWGRYVGSPTEPDPVVVWKQNFRSQEFVSNLVALSSNDVLGLPSRSTSLMQYTKDKGGSIVNISGIRAVLVSWGYNDGVVRAKWKKEIPASALVSTSALDPVTVCCSEPGTSHLWMGHSSGNLTVYRFDFVGNEDLIEFSQNPVQLVGHKKAVMNICISRAFSIVVTSSLDGDIIIWDLNNASYVRSIDFNLGAVTSVAVSSTLGDIASVSANAVDMPNVLHLHTINATLIGSLPIKETVTSMCFSGAPEGVSVNVIACGLANGAIRLFSTWDLKLLREISSPYLSRSVASLTYTHDSLLLYASYSDGTVVAWESSGGKSKTKACKFFNLKM